MLDSRAIPFSLILPHYTREMPRFFGTLWHRGDTEYKRLTIHSINASQRRPSRHTQGVRSQTRPLAFPPGSITTRLVVTVILVVHVKLQMIPPVARQAANDFSVPVASLLAPLSVFTSGCASYYLSRFEVRDFAVAVLFVFNSVALIVSFLVSCAILFFALADTSA